MGPHPLLSTAAVRAHFSLTQKELARFLGITKAQVNNVEKGRSSFSAAVERRLRLLTRWLPQNQAQPLPAPVVGEAPGLLDPGPLQDRLERCRHLARGARYELEELGRRIEAGRRRKQALEELGTILTPAPALPAALPPDPASDPERDAAWLERLRADTACAPNPPGAAEVALLRVRLATLEFEVGQLEQLL
ncbi:helix-turn-helix domain-containing protein [Hymenobacter cellulosilyticus]|uniref:Helix-turn-helix domain-containing protein n=1 Tax=Hymenobacter cellulosilyticus TaxID=2932248 RepID=A0A8T9QFE2_9BACT|nr:helix-turn-helix transcriptional regulator [Hymenobacter cellulosilyticus]UOQ73553.1 helix-turn-helix domain-containing protein [Hymenobacter cellulosilyticus]